ncbi:hypothetical protein GCK72_004787 [Caenorhabditis remanei]|uniref:Uncharacterized protein n=1 Tax=Caenorhabditis remanei TaxID=31234 RepID=A0A6A5HCD3_CAERE|nr:hypothetical protein GCK72_004787 [Caenorhabditis remanei]KAF1764837.1 hypothetical protein GCK72_004787 [Caenorhabditis remanei]
MDPQYSSSIQQLIEKAAYYRETLAVSQDGITTCMEFEQQYSDMMKWEQENHKSMGVDYCKLSDKNKKDLAFYQKTAMKSQKKLDKVLEKADKLGIVA